jgi:predicted small secreted protein
MQHSLKVVILLASLVLAGCQTAGGAISGAGRDLQRAGDWINSKI